MVDIVGGGRVSLVLGIGHETGLIDAVAGLPPATSTQIAEAAGLHERYVRKWLGAMVTACIAEHDPSALSGAPRRRRA